MKQDSDRNKQTDPLGKNTSLEKPDIFSFEHNWRRFQVDHTGFKRIAGVTSSQYGELYKSYWQVAADLIKPFHRGNNYKFVENTRILTNDMFSYATNMPAGGFSFVESELMLTNDQKKADWLTGKSTSKLTVTSDVLLSKEAQKKTEEKSQEEQRKSREKLKGRLVDSLEKLKLDFDIINHVDELFNTTIVNSVDLHKNQEARKEAAAEIEAETGKPVIASNKSPFIHDPEREGPFVQEALTEKELEAELKEEQRQAFWRGQENMDRAVEESKETARVTREINEVEAAEIEAANARKKEIKPTPGLIVNSSASEFDILDAEDAIEQLSYSLDVINNGDEVLDGSIKPERHLAESNFINRLTKEESGLMDWVKKYSLEKTHDALGTPGDPDDTRVAFYALNEDVNQYINGIKEDRALMKGATNLLDASIAHGRSLNTILFDKDKKMVELYGHLRTTNMGGMLISSLTDVAGRNDEMIQVHMANILESSMHMMNRIHMPAKDRTDIWKLNKQIKTFHSSSYNTESEFYKDFYQAMDIREEMNEMKGVMYEERLMQISDFRAYLDESAGKRVDEDAADDDLYKHMKAEREMLERNDAAYERYKEALIAHENDKKERPRQPATMFRAAIEQQFLENPNSADLKNISIETAVDLRNVIQKSVANEVNAKAEKVKKEKELEGIFKKIDSDKAFDTLLRFQQRVGINGGALKALYDEASSFNAKNVERIDELRKLMSEITTDVTKVVIKDYGFVDELGVFKVDDPEAKKKAWSFIDKATRESLETHEEYQAHLNEYQQLNDEYFNAYSAYKSKVTDIESTDYWSEMNEAERKEIEKMDKYRKQVSETKEQIAAQQLIIDQKGYTPDIAKNMDLTITPVTVEKLRAALGSGNEPSYELIREKDDGFMNKNQWLNVYQSKGTVHMPKSKVGYQVKGIQGNQAIIQKEGIMMDDIKFKIPNELAIDQESLKQSIGTMNERQRIESLSATDFEEEQIFGKELQSQKLIEIKYDTANINEDVRKKINPYVVNELQKVEGLLRENMKGALGVQHVYMTPDNMKAYFEEGAWKNIGNDIDTISNRVLMPEYLSKMMQSHANYMLQNPGEAAGVAWEAQRNVFEQMGKQQSTLDLTTEGLVRRWKMANFGSDSIDLNEENKALLQTFEAGLEGNSVTKRMEDAIFLDVLKEMHNVHYKEKGGRDGNYKIRMVADALEANGRKATPQAIFNTLQHGKMNDFYNEFGSYRDAKSLTLEEIREEMAGTNEPETLHFDEDGSAIGIAESAEAEYLQSQEPPSKKPKKKLLTEAQRYEKMKEQMDSFDATNMNKQNLQTLFDLAKTQNITEFSGTVKLPGTEEAVNAVFSQGSQGEFLAYVPKVDKHFSLMESANEGLDEIDVRDVQPNTYRQSMAKVTDVGRGGTPMRDSFLDYRSVQRSGDYAIAANPSVTADELLKFYTGKKPVAYMDIETTGLEESTLPRNVLQPIEVYAQKVQWDNENGGLLTVKDEGGKVIDYGVKNRKGETVVRDKRIYSALTSETKEYMNQVIDDSDFTFRIQEDGREFSVIDFMEEERLVKEGTIKKGQIRDMILASPNSTQIMDEVTRKSDNLWFLRNIAKYANDASELEGKALTAFQMHSGGVPLPNFVSEMSGQQSRMRIGSPEAQAVVEDVRIKQEAYISQLKQDALQASDRLDVLSQKPNSTTTDLGGLFKRLTTFLGKTTVVGQNVGAADIGFLIKSVDLFEGEAKLTMNEKVDSAKKDFYTARTALVEGIDDLRNDDLEASKLYLGMADDDGILDQYAGTTRKERGVYSRFNDWMAAAREKNDKKSGYFIAEKMDTGAAAESMSRIQAFEGILDKLHASGKAMPSLEKEEIALLQENGLMDSLNAVQGHADVIKQVADEQSRNEEAKIQGAEYRRKLNDRSLIEQEFLSKWVNPELPNHKAQTQLAKYGFDDGNYHLGENDVKANLKLFDTYSKAMVQPNMGFVVENNGSYEPNFDHTPYTVGDIVHMKKQVGSASRGLYTIDQIDLKTNQISIGKIGEPDTKAVIEGNSNIDLSAKFERDFAYVGSDINDENVALKMNEIEYDETRRGLLRAMDGSFQFKQAEMESQEIKEYGQLQNTAANNLKGHLTDARRNMEIASVFTDDNGNPGYIDRMAPEQKIAWDNNQLIDSLNTMDLSQKQVSKERAQALTNMGSFFESKVGQEIGGFLNEVDELQKVGAIGKNDSGKMLSEWNERIKKVAQEKGARHTIPNTYNLGNYSKQVAPDVTRTFENLRLDTSSTSSIVDSLSTIGRKMLSLSRAVDPESQYQGMLDNYLTPFLQEKKLVPELKAGENVSMNQLVGHVRNAVNKGVELQPFEQFDPTKLEGLSEDAGFIETLKQARQEITGNAIGSLSPMQKAHIEGMREKEALMRESNSYIPHMNFQPDAEQRMNIVTDTINGKGFTEIGNMPTSSLVHATQMFDGNKTVSTDIRNAVFSELFNRATNGQNISRGDVDDLLSRPDAESNKQIQAMKALNWVSESKDGLLYNENVGEHYFGAPGRNASKRFRQVPQATLDGIANQKVGDYTRDNNYNYLQRKVQAYKGSNYPNHSGVIKEPFVQTVNERGERVDTTGQESANNSIKERAEQVRQQQGTLKGESGQTQQSQLRQDQSYYEEIERPVVDSTPQPERPISALEDWAGRGRDRVKNTASNLVESLDMGQGGAGRWIAGLGIAAFALSMFNKAGSPLKLEERPEGHGVAGPTGQKEDAISFGDEGSNEGPKKPPSTGGKTYLNSGDKGYEIQARGKASPNMNYEQMQQKVKESGGANEVNINMRDDRQSLDRSWLEEQFNGFLDRGYVGEQ